MKRILLSTICIFILFTISLNIYSQSWEYYDSIRYMHNVRGDFDSAIYYGYKVLDIRGVEDGVTDSTYADGLLIVAFLYYQKGDIEKSLHYMEKELEIRELFKAQNLVKYMNSLNNLADVYYEIDISRSVYYYEMYSKYYPELFGEDDPEYSLYLNIVGILNQNLDKYEKAIQSYEKAIEIILKYFDKTHENYGLVSNNLARAYFNIARYDQALPYYLAASENFAVNYGKDSYNYGISIDNLGNLYKEIGQYELAESHFSHAGSIFKASVGDEHPSYAISLSNLATLYKLTDRPTEALPLLIQAVDITKKSYGTEHPQYGIFLNNLAALYHDLNMHEESLELYIESLENARVSVGKNHSWYGIRLNNIANLYEIMGEYEKALPMYIESRDITKRNLGTDHSMYSINLMNLGRIYQRFRDYDNTAKMYKEAFLNNYNNIKRNFSFLSETEKESFVATVTNNLNIIQSFYSDYAEIQPEIAAEAYNIELATKGMILQSGIQMRLAILNSGDKEAIKKFDEWQGIREELAAQYSLPESMRIPDIQQKEREAEMIEGQLSRLSEAFRQTTSLGSSTWKDVRNALGENEVAIEFAVFNYGKDDVNPGHLRYKALVLKPEDKHPISINLFSESQLDKLLATGTDAMLVSNLYRGVMMFSSPGAESMDYGSKLYELLWKPIENYVDVGSTVYFSPSGSLHQIAFAAIADEDEIRLSDKYKLVQLSTTAILTNESPSEFEKPEQIVLYGGIEYNYADKDVLASVDLRSSDDDKSDGLRGGLAWDYLPGTLNEVIAIQKLAKKSKINTTLYSGLNASEESFKRLSGSASPHIIHVATHGFFFPDVFHDSGNDYTDMSGEMLFRSSTNPLNRSGLLFAGANHSWTGLQNLPGAEDGILTAYEVSNLSLTNTKLVVLSACETGLGDIKGSEGVFGLQRSFKAAGADYLLMSLWKVPDAETAMFMQYFYEKLFDGHSILNAFHKTQDYMKEKFPDDPFSWAAFVLVR